MTWTLTDASGTSRALEDWGLAAVTRELINQGTDVVSLTAAGRASDADPLFAVGSTVRLFRAGVPWFYGRVIQAPGRATAKAEDQLYKLAGPWWYLENLVFQQAWEMAADGTTTLAPTNKSRLILNQKVDGTKLATGAAILEVLAYATARGVPLPVGAVTPAAIAPYMEALDRSCAEVIRAFLRWTPDAAAAFDYTTSPFPTLSIVRRTEARTISLPAYGEPVSALELTPRHDLQAPAVVLKFEQTSDLDGDTYTALEVQSAPDSATGDELGALVMTLDLSGARATYQKQKVRTGFIPTGTDSTTVAWWKGKFAWLTDFASGDIEVLAQTVTMENAGSYPGVTLSDLPNELLEGSVASWMGLASAPLLVQATLKFTGTDSDESQEVWGAAKQRVVYTRVIGTNASTQTYARLTSETEAEAIPTGLAQALFDAVGVLAYDGFIELTEEECSGAAAPGVLLNLSGGRAEWAAMAAQVQQVEEWLDAGRTRVTVGPGKHLGHGDLAELLRVNSQRRPSFRLSERTSGKATGNAAQVQGGDQSPRSDSVVRPSAGGGTAEPNFPFKLMNLSDATGLKVAVNANSFLQLSVAPNDTLPISGLGSAISVAVGTMIWLEVDFASNAATGASINSGASGWSGYPVPFAYTVTDSIPVLTTAFLLVGYVAAATSALDGTVISGGPADAPVTAKVIQCVRQDVLLRNGCFNGQAAIFPFPHHAPYV